MIQDNIQYYKTLIADYAKKHQKTESLINLLAVSKTKNYQKVIEAIESGQFSFGENYLQEAIDKQNELKNHLDQLVIDQIEWHFIGPIQRNKTKLIAENFDWVHSVDRLIIAERLSNQRSVWLKPLNICLQVNFDLEESKSGFQTLDELTSAVEDIIKLPRLNLRGLMAIPKPRENKEDQRFAFRQVKQALDHLNHKFNLNLDTLSMGMTDDLESAIAEGSTMVRIGTGIFGSR